MKYFLIMLALVVSNAFGAYKLKGSPAALERQNIQADEDGLSRLDEQQLDAFKQKKLLVPLPDDGPVVVDERLPTRYRYVRPWTRKFLSDLGKDFHKKFNVPLQVNSAVRTAEYQEGLRGTNGNAASHRPGPRQSSHLTGATVDIAKKGMSAKQLDWMRHRLLALESKGVIDATEEHRQLVFHIMVFKKYGKAH